MPLHKHVTNPKAIWALRSRGITTPPSAHVAVLPLGRPAADLWVRVHSSVQ
jgi:hypothetical protein